MRIAILIPTIKLGGAEKYWLMNERLSTINVWRKELIWISAIVA